MVLQREDMAVIVVSPMGFLSFLLGSRSGSPEPRWKLQAQAIDLTAFSYGHSRLGIPVSPADDFSAALQTLNTYDDKGNGVELGTAQGVFDSVFVTLASFSGTWLQSGELLDISASTQQGDILKWFGTPYWTDTDDGEVIFFYEYRHGAIELQFEFTDGRTLSFVTLCRNGVLSSEEQRRAYGVTEPWPP